MIDGIVVESECEEGNFLDNNNNNKKKNFVKL